MGRTFRRRRGDAWPECPRNPASWGCRLGDVEIALSEARDPLAIGGLGALECHGGAEVRPVGAASLFRRQQVDVVRPRWFFGAPVEVGGGHGTDDVAGHFHELSGLVCDGGFDRSAMLTVSFGESIRLCCWGKEGWREPRFPPWAAPARRVGVSPIPHALLRFRRPRSRDRRALRAFARCSLRAGRNRSRASSPASSFR